MPRALVALIVAGVVAVVPVAAAGAGSSVDQTAAAERAGVRLPTQEGVQVPFSRILASSEAGDPAPPREPNPATAPGLRSRPEAGPAADAATARRAAGPTVPAPNLGASFLGTQLTDGPGAIPPDSMGAVGPSQVMVVVNGRLRVFSKAGAMQFDTDLDTFFDSVRGGFVTADPHVRYDRLSGRWFLVVISADPNGTLAPNKLLVAVSSGSTINGQSSFTFFSFGQPPEDASLFIDFPSLGVDRSALYIGANNFTPAGTFASTSGFVVRKSDLLAGTLTTFAFPGLGTGAAAGPFAPQGVQNDDPSSTAGYFIGPDTQVFGQLDLRRVSDPGGTPTISGNIPLDVPVTTFPINVPAQGTSTTLDAIDDRLSAATIVKDPVTGTPRLWTAHNLQVDSAGAASNTGGRDGSRWYEIGNLATTPTLVQTGTVFDPAATNPAFFWMPSIVANGQGQAVIGTSIAGVGRLAGIAIAQRFQSDPPGAMGSPVIAQPGLDAYNITVTDPQRWGDYSQTVVDPNDNMTFWTFQEYANTRNAAAPDGNWAVRAIQVLARPPATPSAAAPATVPVGRASVEVRITGTSTDNSGFFDPGPDTGGPGFVNHISATVSGGVKVNEITFQDPTHVLLDLDTRGVGIGPKTVTIENPDGQSASGARVLTVVDELAPRTTVSGPRRTTDPTPTFRFRSNEPGSRFRCKVDRKKFRRCRSPKTLAQQTLGEHVFKVKAIDRAGNVDRTPARLRFAILP